MKIQYLGQNSLVIELTNAKLLIDPAMSINPLAQHINKEDIEADFILLTHAHGDHVADVIPIAEATGATIVSNFEVATYYGEKGFKHHPMNHGGQWNFDFGTLAMVNAVHSSVFPDGTNGGNPVGFILMADDKTVYIAGDTALTYDMKLIPMLYPSLDLAILPIGDNFTMGIDGAIHAAQFVEVKHVLGCHYDTFPYIEIDKDEASRKFSAAGIQLSLPAVGDSITI